MSENQRCFRSMKKTDLTAVAEIERNVFSRPWSENAFATALPYHNHSVFHRQFIEVSANSAVFKSKALIEMNGILIGNTNYRVPACGKGMGIFFK